MPRIAVIGTSYVGLTTGAALASLGHDVVCADVVVDKIEGLRRGVLPIFEAGLAELVRAGLDAGRLAFEVGAPAAVPGAEFVFLCVQTPQSGDGAADMSFVQAAAAEIGPHLAPGTVVVNKSTVPVGSTRVVERALGRRDVAVVSNPEFLREGSAVHDCLHPDRVVIGTDDAAAAERVRALFADLGAPVIVTDPASAETIKYAANAFLATKVSFANAVANLCEAVGADAADVMRGLGTDHRIGPWFLSPGPGWGGSCLPKDTAALIRIGDDAGYDFSLLRGVVAVNEEQFARVVAKAVRLARGALNGRVVAVWGLSFKAGTDDIRSSPALEVVRRLAARGAVVRAYDPAAGEVPGIERCDDPYAACEGADVLVVLTEWPELASLDLAKVKEAMACPAVVDARNLLDGAAARALGFAYEGVGRR